MTQGRVHEGIVPFRYQVTEKDCVPTSILNAISLLLKRKHIPQEVLRAVYTCTLDDPGEGTTPGGERAAIALLEDIRQRHPKFRIHSRLIGPAYDSDVGRTKTEFLDLFKRLGQHGETRACMVLRVTDGLRSERDVKLHALLALQWDAETASLEAFDPCLKGSSFTNGPQRFPAHEPQERNLRIPASWLKGPPFEERTPYRLPPNKERAGILMYTGPSPLD